MAGIVCLACAALAKAQDQGEAARAVVPSPNPSARLRGIIDHNQTWSGRVMVTGDLTILDAEVSIEPGTVIEFADASPGPGPVLAFGAPDRPCGRLSLLSSAESPIIFRTKPGTKPGRIEAHLTRRDVRRWVGSTPKADGAKTEEFVWQHLRFEDLGVPSEPLGPAPRSRRAVDGPAVALHVYGQKTGLILTECEFERSGELRVVCETGSSVRVTNNLLADSRDRVAIAILQGDGAQPTESVLVEGNRSSSAILVRGLSTQVGGNVLIGPDAAIVLQGGPMPRSEVTGNFVWNTSDRDDGRYCLDCRNPEAVIRDNVLRGGASCVFTGARTMRGNAIIAATRLTGPDGASRLTRELVRALPTSSLFERNLLIGPAYSMIVPQPTVADAEESRRGDWTIVRHNVLDGMGESVRGIHLNPPGRADASVEAHSNLFLRTSHPIYDNRAGGGGAHLKADYNAAAPSPGRPLDRTIGAARELAIGGTASHDIVKSDIAGLFLASLPPVRLPEFKEAVWSGRLSVDQCRSALFEAYRPRPTSPLVQAGKALSSADAGSSRPSIGWAEPAPE